MRVVKVEALYYRYPGSDREVLRNINFEVEQGTFLSIIGPNGAGKSTIFRILLKELIPEKGKIEIWGKNLDLYTQKELARVISALPSTDIKDSSLTVNEYLELARYPFTTGFIKTLKKLDYNLIENAKRITGIEKLGERYLSELSSGELSRVRIARTIAQDGEIFLMDEPTAHLDIDHRLWLLSTLRRLKASSKTIIIILHDIGLAYKYSDEILLLNRGEVKFFGKKEDIGKDLLEEVFNVRIRKVENELLFEEK